jgi:hypothetical protein
VKPGAEVSVLVDTAKEEVDRLKRRIQQFFGEVLMMLLEMFQVRNSSKQ